ncbi:MAG: membrane dipeptidase, partial [Candidatus Acidiferrales bacterium]
MARVGLLVFGCLLGGLLPLLALPSRPEISAKARALHFRSIVVDTHDDTTQRLLNPQFDLGERHTDGSVDIPRMREGGVNAIFFSIWIPGSVTGPEAVKRAMDQ